MNSNNMNSNTSNNKPPLSHCQQVCLNTPGCKSWTTDALEIDCILHGDLENVWEMNYQNMSGSPNNWNQAANTMTNSSNNWNQAANTMACSPNNWNQAANIITYSPNTDGVQVTRVYTERNKAQPVESGWKPMPNTVQVQPKNNNSIGNSIRNFFGNFRM